MTMLETSRSDHLENTGVGVEDAASRPGLNFALKIFLCAPRAVLPVHNIGAYLE